MKDRLQGEKNIPRKPNQTLIQYIWKYPIQLYRTNQTLPCVRTLIEPKEQEKGPNPTLKYPFKKLAQKLSQLPSIKKKKEEKLKTMQDCKKESAFADPRKR